jgi:hypothetical protein
MSCNSDRKVYEGIIKADDSNVPIRYVIPEETYYLEEIYNPYLFKFNDNDNHFYIPDLRECDIKVYSKDFNYIKSIGERGQGPGEFYNLNAHAFNDENSLFVLEKNRLQIIDDQGNYISGFRLEKENNYVEILSGQRILLNPSPHTHLFTVLDYEGNELKRFGKFIRDDDNPEARRDYNYICLDTDSDDNIYLSFLNNTVIRKYDGKYNLVFEVDISGLKEIRESYDQWEKEEMPRGFFLPREEWDKFHSRNIGYTRDIAVDDKYYYLLPGFRSGGTVLLKFDKVSGQLIEKTGILASEGAYFSIDAKPSNYLYLNVFNRGSLPAIIKIRKN